MTAEKAGRALPYLRIWKFGPLFRKDLKDMLANGQVLLIAAMPVLLVLLYKNMNFGGEGMPPELLLLMGGVMALCMAPVTIPSMTIAEEKEKFTLRTLMLSNVSALEFLLSKALATLLLTLVIEAVVYAVAIPALTGIAGYLLAIAGSSVCMMLLGALVGILSKNQMSTGLLTAPIMLLMLLPTMLSAIGENIERFARFLPTHAAMRLILGGGGAFQYVVLAAWTVLAAAAFALAYRAKRLD